VLTVVVFQLLMGFDVVVRMIRSKMALFNQNRSKNIVDSVINGL